MRHKIPKKINFDAEVYDGKSALRAYSTLLKIFYEETAIIPLIRNGLKVELSDILISESCCLGFSARSSSRAY